MSYNFVVLILTLASGFLVSCDSNIGSPSGPMANDCTLVSDGFGPDGSASVTATTVVSGLEVPWGIAFLSTGNFLLTERPGRVRRVQDDVLLPQPVVTIEDSDTEEGGLLGIALHPDFNVNRLFYLYRTIQPIGETPRNRVERWLMSDDGRSATREGIILDEIPAAIFHNGGRLRIGPDEKLYIGTGDSENPSLSQNVNSLAGKILRLNLDGSIPSDNPFPGNPVFISGIRNTQGFDWPNATTMWVTDHGPSGELGRSDHDEVSVVQAGDNLGWPIIFGCEAADGLVSPSISWSTATPPGGAAIYTGNAIPEWSGSLLVGTLGSTHLQRVVISADGRTTSHEVYFRNQLGRIRDVIMGPDNHLYITTSNCDGRGICPLDRDKVLRITS